MEEEYPVLTRKLVIVEDNPALAEIYKTRLELIGYTVFVAQDGEIALTLIERELPDLVLLDLMIPKIAGGEVLEQMRASEWGKSIRVYEYTSYLTLMNMKHLRTCANLVSKAMLSRRI